MRVGSLRELAAVVLVSVLGIAHAAGPAASAPADAGVATGAAPTSSTVLAATPQFRIRPADDAWRTGLDHPSTRFRIHDAMRWREAMGTP